MLSTHNPPPLRVKWHIHIDIFDIQLTNDLRSKIYLANSEVISKLSIVHGYFLKTFTDYQAHTNIKCYVI